MEPESLNIRDLTDHTFGELQVLSLAGSGPRKAALWLCRCSCGNKTVARSAALVKGHKKSCGHLKRGYLKHGHTANGKTTTEYFTWHSMKERCLNPKCNGYKYYGGRGIRVCEGWLTSFERFLADMGLKPEPHANYSLDRIDPNGNYEPGNCRWATRKDQAANRRLEAALRRIDALESNLTQYKNLYGNLK